MRKVVPVILLLMPMLFSACYHSTGIPKPTSIVTQVDDSNQNDFIGTGPKVMASAGDYYVSNNYFEAVIDGGIVGERKQTYLAPTGGSIIDISNITVDSLGQRTSYQNDNLNQIFQVVNANLGTPIAYTSIKVQELSDLASTIKMTGYVMDRDGSLAAAGMTVDPTTKLVNALQVETLYHIEKNNQALQITTTVSNTGAVTAPIQTVGDYVFLGGNNQKPFIGAPGYGFCPATGTTNPIYAPFATFVARAKTYQSFAMYSVDDGVVEVTFDGGNRAYRRSGGEFLTVSKPSHRTDTLEAGGAITFVRNLVPTQATTQYNSAFYAITELINSGNPRSLFTETGALTGTIDYAVKHADLVVTAEQLIPGLYFNGDQIVSSPIPVPVASTRTTAAGSFNLVLPPGRYQLRISGNDLDNYVVTQYTITDVGDPDVTGDETTTSHPIDVVSTKTITMANAIEISSQITGSVETFTRNANNDLIPTRVTVLPDDTSQPVYFNDEEQGENGSLNYFFNYNGDRKIKLYEGSFQFLVSHGPLYDLQKQAVSVSQTQDDTGNTTITSTPENVDVTLTQVVDPGSYLSLDPVVKTAGTYNCSVARPDRMMSVLCEGVDSIIGGDIDVITDYSKYAKELENSYYSQVSSKINIDSNSVHVIEGAGIKNFKPDNLLSSGFGEYVAFPLTHKNGTKGFGVGETGGRRFASIMDNLQNTSDTPVHAILVNPRGEDQLPNGMVSGLFTSMAQPVPASLNDSYFRQVSELGTGTANDSFDMIEVLAGNNYTHYLQTRLDWFNILSEGYTKWACGGSGYLSNAPHFAGSPRTWVRYSQTDYDEATFIQDFTAGHSFVSTGPFLDVTVGDHVPGDLVTSTDGTVSLTIKVQAPDWIPVDELRVVVNGAVVQTVDLTGQTQTVRYSGTLQVNVPDSDSFVVVECGASLANIANGVLPTGDFATIYPDTQPIAFTNPFLVDRNGDGSWH